MVCTAGRAEAKILTAIRIRKRPRKDDHGIKTAAESELTPLSLELRSVLKAND